MTSNRRAIVAACTFAIASAAHAQDGQQLETIAVTGSRVAYRDLLDTPAVSIVRPGDYLTLSFTLVNDTRSEKGREDEIYATIEKLLAATGKRFDLLHGDTAATVLTAKNFRVPLENEEKRPDVSKVTLTVRTTIAGDASHGDELTRELRDFVAKAARVGRTEIDAEKETGVSLTKPERFRYDIVKAIAEDTAKVRAQLGEGCKVELEGLSSRIEWRRASVSELLLYIPYNMKVEGCGESARGG